MSSFMGVHPLPGTSPSQDIKHSYPAEKRLPPQQQQQKQQKETVQSLSSSFGYQMMYELCYKTQHNIAYIVKQ